MFKMNYVNAFTKGSIGQEEERERTEVENIPCQVIFRDLQKEKMSQNLFFPNLVCRLVMVKS